MLKVIVMDGAGQRAVFQRRMMAQDSRSIEDGIEIDGGCAPRKIVQILQNRSDKQQVAYPPVTVTLDQNVRVSEDGLWADRPVHPTTLQVADRAYLRLQRIKMIVVQDVPSMGVEQPYLIIALNPLARGLERYDNK
jgi:hypothetical protein